MKKNIVLAVLCMFLAMAALSENIFQKFNRSAYYAAIKSGKIDEVNNELANLVLLPSNEKNAFEGALLMRKAGLVPIPAQKLKFFKEGRIKLETAIAKDTTITEYRFLRLIIQENAPKIVKYKSELTADKLYIQKHFRSLPSATQEAVVDYTKTSKILSLPAVFDNL